MIWPFRRKRAITEADVLFHACRALAVFKNSEEDRRVIHCYAPDGFEYRVTLEKTLIDDGAERMIEEAFK